MAAEHSEQNRPVTEVVAALIWQNDRFMICQRPAYKARGLLWEFVGGKVEPVSMVFQNRMMNAVIDRFGRDVMLIREDDEHFSVSIEAVVSPQFYAWVFGFGTEAEILSPAHVRDGMADVAASVLKAYRKD